VLCMLVQKGRGRCAVFMGAAFTRDSREGSCLIKECWEAVCGLVGTYSVLFGVPGPIR